MIFCLPIKLFKRKKLSPLIFMCSWRADLLALASSIHISFLEGRRKIIKKTLQLIPHHLSQDEDGFNILICLNSLKGPKAFPVSQTSSRVSSSPHLIYRVCNNRQNVSTYFLYFCRSTGRVPEKNYFHLFMSCIKARISSMSWRYVSRMIRSI